MSVSIFCSAVRPAMWDSLFESFKNSSVDYEIVFAGHCSRQEIEPFCKQNNFRYIHTARIKPSQCYQIALNNCTKETVLWIADDAASFGDIVGKSYRYWKAQNNEKLILSLQTKESGYYAPDGEFCDMNLHRFFGNEVSSPLMAPIALLSRKFVIELGGFDRRYIAGQWENALVMRAYQHGAKVEIFGDKASYVEIDHLKKSIAVGESTNRDTFLERPFAKGYELDRQVLEASWTIFDEKHAFQRLEAGERPRNLRDVVSKQVDEFQPYSKNISLTKSEGTNIPEMWD